MTVAMMGRRSIGFVLVVLVIGALVGTLVGTLLGGALPAGVVREFFLRSVELSLGGLLGGSSDAVTLDLGVFKLILGLACRFNFASLIGLAIAYYFLRYFR